MNNIPYKNQAHVAGFVGNDPQLRYLPAGDAVLSIRIATKHFWKDASHVWQSAVEWHTAVFYRQLAELVNSHAFKKGDFIDAEGRIHTREWQDDKNHKRSSREIIIERFHRVDMAGTQKQDQDLDSTGAPGDSSADNSCDPAGMKSLATFKKLT